MTTRRRTAFAFVGFALAATACSASSDNLGSDEAVAVPGAAVSQNDPGATPSGTLATDPSILIDDAAVPTSLPFDGESSTTTTTPGQVDPATPGADATGSVPPDSSAPGSSVPSTGTSTTTTVPGLDVFEPSCVVQVQSGDSIGLIADEFDDPTVNINTIIAENDIEGDEIYPDQLLDVCVDNGLDDITGAEREPNEAVVAAGRLDAVKSQQNKLNALFATSGMRDLLVDGVSGPVTRQRLCAARVSLGLPVTNTDMEAGSEEEATLMAAASLLIPFTTAAASDRWILIDRTCQIMFVGQGGNSLDYVFSTSTGEAGFETRDQNRTRAYRFDPALDNGGWHNSTTYPVPEDNPLNGNMYKPIYFDGGQAIHGSNNVPTTPQSKGCARLRVADQDALVGWLGLASTPGPFNSTRQLNVTVNVQGAYQIPGSDLFGDQPVDA